MVKMEWELPLNKSKEYWMVNEERILPLHMLNKYMNGKVRKKFTFYMHIWTF